MTAQWFICPKCHDRFLKQARFDKHVSKCPGKKCRNCGAIGHLACGISISGEELMKRIRETGGAKWIGKR